jgi:hypothetical protein
MARRWLLFPSKRSSAVLIRSRSKRTTSSASEARSGGVSGRGVPSRSKSSTSVRKAPGSASSTARSMMFSSSRTLPR